MAAARAAAALPLHHQLVHGALDELDSIAGAREGRPAGAGFELGSAGEQLRRHADARARTAHVATRAMLPVQRGRERALRT